MVAFHLIIYIILYHMTIYHIFHHILLLKLMELYSMEYLLYLLIFYQHLIILLNQNQLFLIIYFMYHITYFMVLNHDELCYFYVNIQYLIIFVSLYLRFYSNRKFFEILCKKINHHLHIVTL